MKLTPERLNLILTLIIIILAYVAITAILSPNWNDNIPAGVVKIAQYLETH